MLSAGGRQPRDLVTLRQGAMRIGRELSTVRGWAHREQVFRVGIDADGRDVYDLAALRAVDAATPRRRRRTKEQQPAQGSRSRA